METLIYHLFIQNWQRKLLALVTAIVVWFFVNHSIIETKVITSVPIRVINLPAEKTIVGLLPNGILSKRVTLTLSGTKEVIHELEPGDIEVVLDASTINKDEWILSLTKKNLVSLNPSIDLIHHITFIEPSEYIVKMSRLVTAKIPVIISVVGEAPPGYEFLDVWPQRLLQTVSGPEQEIHNSKTKGFEIIFDLNEITKADLDAIKSFQITNQEDEISLPVPTYWKEIPIPFRYGATEELNDPEAQNLKLDFLRKEYLSLGKEIPIRVFYPFKTSELINPLNTNLATGNHIHEKYGIMLFTPHLYVYDVSRLFLNIVKENMELTITAAPKSERDLLQWSLEIINPHQLEDTYVAFLKSINDKSGQTQISKSREEILRKRFRHYLEQISLYLSPMHKLSIESHLENNTIKVSLFK